MIIDVASRKPFRSLRILGSNGTLEWEKFDSVIKLYDAKSRNTKIIKVPKGYVQKGYEIASNAEQMYNDEIGTFLRAIEGKGKYPHSFAENLVLLETLYALEKSDKTAKKVSLI